MSQFPGSLDVFTDKTGADDIASSDPNNAFDGVEAVEGLLGALGKPQSWSTTLLTLLRRHQRGMRVDCVGGTLYARAGEAVLENTAGNKFVFRRNTGDVTLLAGHLDVGALAATFYYVYAKGDGAATTAPICYSTDINAPSGIGTAPYLKIGWFKNEAAAALAVTFAGSWREWGDAPNQAQVTNTNDATISSTAYADVPTKPLTINFVSSGRPIQVHLVANFESATKEAGFMIEIDGTQKVEGNIGKSSEDGGYSAGLDWIEPGLTAGAHVIKALMKCDTSGPQMQGSAAGPVVLNAIEL